MIVLGLLLSVGCATAEGLPVAAVHATEPDQGPDPRLVVVVIVDQLRGDMLDLYGSAFTGGFKRLMENGLVFSQALHSHAQTETSPGHAAISTAVFPTRAGIPSNLWREANGGELQPVYNVVDPAESLVGITGLPGSSPSVLRREGLADWIAESANGRVVSISAKDRAAVLMGGKEKGEVYWFDSQVGRFVTSTYYRSQNPSWLDRFNERDMPAFKNDSVWASTVPAEFESLSAPDTAVFEGDGVHTFFPHRYHEEVAEAEQGDFFLWFETTPMLDKATLDLTLVAMDEEELGQSDDRVDFLSVSFSQTDRIGHAYGPLSREQLDNLLRLDQLLEEFFTALDERVGKDHYVLGFTSDHGIMNNPERIDGGGVRLSPEDRSELEQALSAAARRAGADPDLSISAAMVEGMADVPFVGPAYSHESLEDSAPLDSLGVLFQRSYTPGRLGGLISAYGVEMWWKENILAWGMPVGTTHGSPYYYDRWVPMIFLGPGLNPRTEERPVSPMDLVPTLAAWAGIPVPDDLDGQALFAPPKTDSKVVPAGGR